MNWDIIFALIFYGLILIYFFTHRKKFDVQGRIMVLYRTKLGIKLMDKISNKWPRFLKSLSSFGIFVGFLGMLFIFFFLVYAAFNLVVNPKAEPALAPVLPGIAIPGAPPLSFWHWIIAIFFVAIIHEFSHGVVARLNGLKIKSSGFAFLGPILAAFVEPNEKELEKKSKKAQLQVFAAGPFSNIIMAGLFFLLITYVTMPFMLSFFDRNGIYVIGTAKDSPVYNAGINISEKILTINGEKIENTTIFLTVLKDLKPGDEVDINTDKKAYVITAVSNPTDKEKGYLGIIVNDMKLKEGVSINSAKTVFWFNQLFVWIFIISLGVGLFNLLPLGPVDGGRMFNTASQHLIKDKKKALKVWGLVSLFCLLMIFINILPWIKKLFLFLFNLSF